jgi:hypothetical protein
MKEPASTGDQPAPAILWKFLISLFISFAICGLHPPLSCSTDW